MKIKSKYLPYLFGICITIGMFIGYKIAKNMLPVWSGGTDIITTIINKIDANYVHKVNTEKLKEEMVNSALEKLDPFSTYIPPAELSVVNEQINGGFQGIGVEYTAILDTPMVIRTIEGSGGTKAGILPGDQLLKADTHSLLGIHDIGKFVKGPQGTKVLLTIKRQIKGEKKILKLLVNRSIVKIQSSHIAYQIRPQIGYIKLNRFSMNSYTELHNSLKRLLQQGMRKVILDLRNNGGGVLEAALNIAGDFLPKDKLILYTEDDYHHRHYEYHNQNDGLFKDIAVVVLMNRFSASASEVVAGSLQDWDRATIIGETSFGKGLVQEQYPLSNHGALRLTIARYYTPIGRCIQKNYFSNQQQKSRILNYDSSLFKVDTFTTAAGKKLFSSGGIRPDIFISQNLSIPINKHDTGDFLKVVNSKNFRNNLMQYFSNNYLTWRNQYSKPQVFLDSLQFSPNLIDKILEPLGKTVRPSLRNTIIIKLSFELMSLLFKDQEYLPILLEKDPSIQASLNYFTNLEALK